MHLSKLLDQEIVQSRREEKSIIYSIKNKKVYDIFETLNSKKYILNLFLNFYKLCKHRCLLFLKKLKCE